MKIALCLLTWNELEGCLHDVPRLPLEQFDEVFALDNNSTDGTIEFLQSQGIQVFQQKKPTYNGAYIDAFEICNTDALVFFHPKGSILDPKVILKFREYFDAGYDLIVASRLMKGGRNEEDNDFIKPRKWFIVLFASCLFLLWKKSGNTVWDVLHGCRGMRKSAFFKIAPLTKGVTIDAEMVARSYKKKNKCIEFPIHETLRISGSTHFPAFKTGRKLLKYLWKEIWRKD